MLMICVKNSALLPSKTTENENSDLNKWGKIIDLVTVEPKAKSHYHLRKAAVVSSTIVAGRADEELLDRENSDRA